MPFLGIYAEEIPIPTNVATQIDALLPTSGPGLPRYYRNYVCLSDPNWELQAIYGCDGHPAWTLNNTTQVFQDAFGSHIGSNINASLFGMLPTLQYDSWFTIQADDNADPGNNFSFQSVPLSFANWGTTGGNFTSGAGLGAAITNFTSYPSTSGIPDAFNRILIGQITTDGTFSGLFNFQFRKLNLDGSVFTPLTISHVQSATIDLANNPKTPCSLLLPIELIAFYSEKQNSIVAIHWETASKKNSALFNVQHSTDLEVWKNIAVRDGAGNSAVHVKYDCEDLEPANGLNYYRLLHFDINGSYTTSQILSVNFNSTYGNEYNFYPNPSDGNTVYLTGDISNIENISIYSITGNLEFSSNTYFEKKLYLYPGLTSGNHVAVLKTNDGAFHHFIFPTE